MKSSAGGPLGALLMIAPLAAIPVLAIVGVPQFAPVVASSADEEEISDLGEAVASPTAEPFAPRKSRDDIFAPLDDNHAANDGETQRPKGRPASERPRGFAEAPPAGNASRGGRRGFPPSEALGGWQIAEPAKFVQSGPQSAIEDASSADPEDESLPAPTRLPPEERVSTRICCAQNPVRSARLHPRCRVTMQNCRVFRLATRRVLTCWAIPAPAGRMLRAA
jgi:hypothetical protein